MEPGRVDIMDPPADPLRRRRGFDDESQQTLNAEFATNSTNGFNVYIFDQVWYVVFFFLGAHTQATISILSHLIKHGITTRIAILTINQTMPPSQDVQHSTSVLL